MECGGFRRVGPRTFVSGSSIVGMKYKDGIMMAGDMQASYGSYAKYKGVERIFKVASNTLLGSSGEYSNIQKLVHSLTMEMEEMNDSSGEVFGPRESFEIVKAHMYNKRCKGAPEMNFHIVGGVESKEKREDILPSHSLPFEDDHSGRFLGGVNHLGNFYQASVLASGIGASIALPLLRNKVEGREDEISRDEAINIIEDAMRVLFYRDTTASNVIQIGWVDGQGAHVMGPRELTSKWVS
jgi:20S proteasome subunit beta 7